MKSHLEIATNPYDASIETVMPGVQERFNGVQTKLHHIETKNDSRFDKVDTRFDRMEVAMNELTDNVKKIDSHFQNIGTIRQDIAHSFAAMSRMVGEPYLFNTPPNGMHCPHCSTNSDPARQLPTQPTQPHPDTQRPTQANRPLQNNTDTLNGPRLSPRYPSLALMWDEWYGTGGAGTKDKPIPGGFDELERSQKNKWRSHLDATQSRHFTRIRTIIEGIKKMAQLSNISVDVALSDLEDAWNSNKKSPDSMIRYLQERGYVRKTKPRGKSAHPQRVQP